MNKGYLNLNSVWFSRQEHQQHVRRLSGIQRERRSPQLSLNGSLNYMINSRKRELMKWQTIQDQNQLLLQRLNQIERRQVTPPSVQGTPRGRKRLSENKSRIESENRRLSNKLSNVQSGLKNDMFRNSFRLHKRYQQNMKKFMVEENKVKLRVDVFLDNFEKKKRSNSIHYYKSYIKMIIFLLIWLTNQKSYYYGSIKKQLHPNQTFEYQFFNISGITSVDLYFPDPPYRLVNDSDLQCYWSLQQYGLQQINSIKIDAPDSEDSDLICLGHCLVRQGQFLYGQNTVDLQHSKLNSLLLYQRGLILFYNDEDIVTYDTLQQKTIIQQHNYDFKGAKLAIEHEDYVYICSNGVLVYNLYNQLVAQIYHQAYYTKQEPGKCEWMGISDDYLFLINERVEVYDISDILNITLIITLDVEGDLYDLYENYFAIARFKADQILLSVFKYVDQISPRLILNFTVFTEGYMLNEFDNNKQLKLKFVNNETLSISKKEQIAFIQLKSSPHMKMKHNNTLAVFYHFLTPNNIIHIYNSTIYQVGSGSFNIYKLTEYSYNLVCNSPLKPSKYLYYGVMRSEDKCRQDQEDVKFKPLLENEIDPKIQCYYTFQLSIQVLKNPSSLTRDQKALIIVLTFILFMVGIKCNNDRKKSKIINKLQQFEQLNRLNTQREKIRITHDEDDERDYADNL